MNDEYGEGKRLEKLFLEKDKVSDSQMEGEIE